MLFAIVHTCLNILHELRDEGLISAIGLCNFDTIRVDEICTLLGPGVVCTNQVQVSLSNPRDSCTCRTFMTFDMFTTVFADWHTSTSWHVRCVRKTPFKAPDIRHPGENPMPKSHATGSVWHYFFKCGGFLSTQWIDKEEPDPYGSNLSPSQRKVRWDAQIWGMSALNHATQYLDIIVNAWGTWKLFQSLLILLREIGNRHGGVSVSNVATRWVLEHTFVGAVIIGLFLSRLSLESGNWYNWRRAFGHHGPRWR